MYDYLEQVTADVRDYVEQEIDLTEWAGDRDGLEEKLNDDTIRCYLLGQAIAAVLDDLEEDGAFEEEEEEEED